MVNDKIGYFSIPYLLFNSSAHPWSNLDLYEYVDVDIEAESNIILFFSATSNFADSVVFHLGWKTDDPETYKSWIKIYGNSGDETFYDKSKWFGVKNKLRYV